MARLGALFACFGCLCSLLLEVQSFGDYYIQHKESKLYVDEHAQLVESKDQAALYRSIYAPRSLYANIKEIKSRKILEIDGGCWGRNITMAKAFQGKHQRFHLESNKPMKSLCHNRRLFVVPDKNMKNLIVEEMLPEQRSRFLFDKISIGHFNFNP
ncbi:uncharacterized protein LOC132705328 [Cylas formicarius]|uniref:uncharacterized protein LOC132705328 n=1 Tax=Cylas formicarius TaxID=197179 RepID=UPI0029586A4E|nr:uncharacterized protein LOC132705328 [Cylas formicarius]